MTKVATDVLANLPVQEEAKVEVAVFTKSKQLRTYAHCAKAKETLARHRMLKKAKAAISLK